MMDERTPTILRLPLEIRLKIYWLLHGKPKISIEDEGFILNRLEPLKQLDKFERRLSINPPASLSGRKFDVVGDDYYWSYLLTCRTFNEEASHIMPILLHLRIASKDFQVNYIPPRVRARYLPHLQTLTVVSRFPLYNFLFDGSELSSLKTLYLFDESGRSRIVQHLDMTAGIRPEDLASVRGDQDQAFIAQGMNKLHLSKMNWWQCGTTLWLHRMLSADTSRIFQLIVQQFVFFRFERGPQERQRYKWILLDVLFDVDTRDLVRRRVRVNGVQEELLNENHICAFLNDDSYSSGSSLEPRIYSTDIT